MLARALTAIATLVLAGSPAFAGGMFVSDNGTQAMQRGGAFVAKADDGSAIFHNPAGLALVPGVNMFVGLNVVMSSRQFQRTGQYEPHLGLAAADQPTYVGQDYPAISWRGRQSIPLIALSYNFGSTAIGFGLFSPHAAPGPDLPSHVVTADGMEAPAPYRYDSIMQKSLVTSPTIAVGHRLGKLSVGFRVSSAYADIRTIKSTQLVANEQEQDGLDAVADVAVIDKSAIHWGASAHYAYDDHWQFGAAYHSPLRIRGAGTADIQFGHTVDLLSAINVDATVEPVDDSVARCAPGGQVGAIAACLEVDLPPIATVGGRYVMRDAEGTEVGDLELDVRWEGWSQSETFVAILDGQVPVVAGVTQITTVPLEDNIIRHGFSDVWSLRVGGSHKLAATDRQVELRGGLSYDTAAKSISWTTVDVDGTPKIGVTGGVGIHLDGYRIDIGLAGVIAPSRLVEEMPMVEGTPPEDRPQPDIQAAISLDGEQDPYNPYNAGSYHSAYVIGSVGVSAEF